ncbi:hypothetical protein C8Q72DRAFT_867481 [Fomitopsis betulina]|nr:hypothetical protein C8Q72DRAFT_867481 [Fomitopsis betulina]
MGDRTREDSHQSPAAASLATFPTRRHRRYECLRLTTLLLAASRFYVPIAEPAPSLTFILPHVHAFSPEPSRCKARTTDLTTAHRYLLVTSIFLPSLPSACTPTAAMRFVYPQRPSPAVYHVRRSATGLHDMYWSGGYYPTAPEMRTVYSQPAIQPAMIYQPQLPPQRHYLSRLNRPYPPVLCCDTCCGGTCCDACCDDLCCDSCCGCGPDCCY